MMSSELPPMLVLYTGHVIQTETPVYCTLIGGISAAYIYIYFIYMNFRIKEFSFCHKL